MGLNAVAGQAREDWTCEPGALQRHDPRLLRPDGTRRRPARRRASLAERRTSRRCPRFGGALFPSFKDKELADVLRAGLERLHDRRVVPGGPPGMFVPDGDRPAVGSDAAVQEIERCLDKGVRGHLLSPRRPSIRRTAVVLRPDYWDPMLALCEEADLPVCMHIGSSGWQPFTSARGAAEPDRRGRLRRHAHPRRRDDVRPGAAGSSPTSRSSTPRAASAGCRPRSSAPTGCTSATAAGPARRRDDLLPSEVCRRNMWFCIIEEPFGLAVRHEHRHRPHHVGVRLPALQLRLARTPSSLGRRAASGRSPTTKQS